MIPAAEDDWLLLPSSPKAWADVLAAILKEAEKARVALAASGDREPQRAVREALNAFIRYSPDKTNGVKELDELAAKTATDLFEASMDAALQRLAESDVRLALILKKIETGTDALEDRAGQVRLAFVNRSLERIRGIAEDLDALGGMLGDLDKNGRISATLKTALSEIRKVEKLLA